LCFALLLCLSRSVIRCRASYPVYSLYIVFFVLARPPRVVTVFPPGPSSICLWIVGGGGGFCY